jgi:lysozyme
MRINEEGLKLLKKFEGCKLKTYRCVAGVLTIGYGHTGKDVTEGMTITKKEAEDLLVKDLERFEAGVKDLVKVSISENQFSALVSFAYNIGLNALSGSTLMKKLNAGDIMGAANQFERWNKAGGKEVQGLTNRRLAERDLFLTAV